MAVSLVCKEVLLAVSLLWSAVVSLVHDLLQACKKYHTMLHGVYGEDLILGPHIMNVDALKDYSTFGMQFLLSMVPLTGRHCVTRPVALFLTCICCLTWLSRVNELPAWWMHLGYLLCVRTLAGRQMSVTNPADSLSCPTFSHSGSECTSHCPCHTHAVSSA